MWRSRMGCILWQMHVTNNSYFIGLSWGWREVCVTDVKNVGRILIATVYCCPLPLVFSVLLVQSWASYPFEKGPSSDKGACSHILRCFFSNTRVCITFISLWWILLFLELLLPCNVVSKSGHIFLLRLCQYGIKQWGYLHVLQSLFLFVHPCICHFHDSMKLFTHVSFIIHPLPQISFFSIAT